MSGCWRTARTEVPSLEKGKGQPWNTNHPWDEKYAEIIDLFLENIEIILIVVKLSNNYTAYR